MLRSICKKAPAFAGALIVIFLYAFRLRKPSFSYTFSVFVIFCIVLFHHFFKAKPQTSKCQNGKANQIEHKACCSGCHPFGSTNPKAKANANINKGEQQSNFYKKHYHGNQNFCHCFYNKLCNFKNCRKC